VSQERILYGSEIWTIKTRDARRITAAGMKYLRKAAEYAWTDYTTDTEISKEINITAVLGKIHEYRRN
jgi:hypothetical protein